MAPKNDVSSPSGDAKGSQAAAAPQGGETVYVPKGWDRPLYRAPDSILFEVRSSGDWGSKVLVEWLLLTSLPVVMSSVWDL